MHRYLILNKDINLLFSILQENLTHIRRAYDKLHVDVKELKNTEHVDKNKDDYKPLNHRRSIKFDESKSHELKVLPTAYTSKTRTEERGTIINKDKKPIKSILINATTATRNPLKSTSVGLDTASNDHCPHHFYRHWKYEPKYDYTLYENNTICSCNSSCLECYS